MWTLFSAYQRQNRKNPILVHEFVGKDAHEVHIKKQRALTYEGFCNFVEDLGIISGETTMDNYFKNFQGRYTEYMGVCSRIKRCIRADQIEGGLAGIYNPSITQRLNGLVEKMEINDEKHTIDLSDLPDELIEQIIAAQRANAGNADGREVQT